MDTKHTHILVHEVTPGVAGIVFCSKEHAEKVQAECIPGQSGASVFSAVDVDADFLYRLTNAGKRVDEAKERLQNEIRLRNIMTANGIPMDPDLRVKIKNVLWEMTGAPAAAREAKALKSRKMAENIAA